MRRVFNHEDVSVALFGNRVRRVAVIRRPRIPSTSRTSVGCAWMVSAMSSTVAPISIASTASAMSSPAPAPADAHAQHAVGFGINDHFRHAVRAVKRQRAARRRPRKFRDFDISTPFSFASFSVKPHHASSGSVKTTAGMTLSNARALAGDDFDGDARLLVRLVREQNAARDVADGVNRRVARLLLRVDLHKALFVQFDFRVFQAEVVAVRHAPDGNQNAVVKFGKFFAVVFGFDFDLFADGGHFGDFGLEPDFLERFFGVRHDGPREIGIRAGENASSASTKMILLPSAA